MERSLHQTNLVVSKVSRSDPAHLASQVIRILNLCAGVTIMNLTRLVESYSSPVLRSCSWFRNPAGQAPVEGKVVEIPLFIGFHTSQLVQDFSHQQ